MSRLIHPTRGVARTLLASLILLSGGASLPSPGDQDDEPRLARPAAGGRLAWIVSDRLDLIGDVWVDAPLPLTEHDAIFVGVDTRLTIERAASELTFDVRNLLYDLELGWRGRRGWTGRRLISVHLGQRGDQRVDDDGQAFARYLGIDLRSRGYRRASAATRFDWRITGGPVLKEREVEADAIVRLDADARLLESRPGGPRLHLDLGLDAVVDDHRVRGDLALGPRLSIPLSGGRFADLFLHYLRSRNPLGVGEDAWMFGFAYSEAASSQATASSPPDVGGSIGLGGGEGRISGRLELRVLSPELRGSARVVFVVDGNILTADDTGELFYLWNLGVERPVGGVLAGVYVHHRSNHQLAEPSDRVTSLNVLEAGIETPRWHRSGARFGPLEARARIGWLVNSDFGEDRRWHLRGGVRWSPLRALRASPFLLAEIEAGDVERQTYALGIAPLKRWEARLEVRNDDQYFGRDRTAILLNVLRGF